MRNRLAPGSRGGCSRIGSLPIIGDLHAVRRISIWRPPGAIMCPEETANSRLPPRTFRPGITG